MTVVTDLDLPEIDLTSGTLSGDTYHRQLAILPREGEFGWLAVSPLALVVLDRESAEFFLRSRATAFPGREIADLFGVTSGRLREQIDANILNQQGERHRRLRALVGGAFTPRAADRWRPAMRAFLGRLWSGLDGAHACEFVAAVAKPYPALTIAAVLGAPEADASRLQDWSSLVPGLRLGWLALPGDLAAEVAARKLAAGRLSSSLDQLTLAEFISSGSYDRQVRRARLTYRQRRDRLVSALAREVPAVEVTGIAAGLHVLVRLPAGLTEDDVVARAAGRGLAIHGLGSCHGGEQNLGPAVIVGYGTPPGHAFSAAVARLCAVLREAVRER